MFLNESFKTPVKTQKMNNTEHEWQDALAGKVSKNNQSAEQIEAIALRRALLSRRDSIERESAKFDSIQFEKMKNVIQFIECKLRNFIALHISSHFFFFYV